MARNYRARFLGNNFADASQTTLTSSSAMSGFALTNLQHNRRSKITRTNGNFTVTSSNKKIYINDGSSKTVTLTEADYDGPAALATHIQTQLNASSSNWTCSYSTSTYKFTIDRTSGTKTLRKSVTTDASWSMLGYGTGTDEDAGEADSARNHTTEWYKWDLGTAVDIKAFCLIGPKSADFTMSTTQATATLYANSVDSWTSPALTVSCTVTADGIFAMLDGEDDTEYRYWKFEFEDKTNTVGPQGFKFGHAYLGDYTTFTARNIAPGWDERLIDPSIELESDGGGLFFDTRTKYRLFEGLQVQLSTQSEQSTWRDFINRVGKSEPFYVFLDPLQNLTSSAAEWGGYVRFADSSVSLLTNVIRNRADIFPASLREVV